MVETSVTRDLSSRKLTEMVYQVMRDKKITLKKAASTLGLSESSLSYRFNRDSFSLQEFITLCNLVGVDLLWRDTGYFNAKQPSSVKSHRPELGVVDE
jgi:hypothetical protein